MRKVLTYLLHYLLVLVYSKLWTSLDIFAIQGGYRIIAEIKKYYKEYKKKKENNKNMQ